MKKLFIIILTITAVLCVSFTANTSNGHGREKLTPDTVFTIIDSMPVANNNINTDNSKNDEIYSICPISTNDIGLPGGFINVEYNQLSDSAVILTSFFNHLSDAKFDIGDSVRILHIGDSHVRGHMFPQAAGDKFRESFGRVLYKDMGIDGGTCMNYIKDPKRIDAIVDFRPELLIISLGTNESYTQKYNSAIHREQLEALYSILRERLPDVPIILTTPPGCYFRHRTRIRRRVYHDTYTIDPHIATSARVITKFASEHGLLSWDLYNIAGGKERACLNWDEAGMYRPDHVHFLPEGYYVQGKLLFEAIIREYNKYVSANIH